MNLNCWNCILAMGPPPQPGAPTAPFIVQVFPLILMVVIFYFLLIRPQQKKSREHGELLKTLKSDDRVVTNGGIVGVVVSVKEQTVTLRSADTKLEVLKSAITEITERSGAPAAKS
jgi:preprotein translocase subunit YajC